MADISTALTGLVAASWPRVVGWLEAEPDQTAKELLLRLRAEGPGEFPDGLLRTLQRRVKEWRRLAASRLVFAMPTPALQPVPPPVSDLDTEPPNRSMPAWHHLRCLSIENFQVKIFARRPGGILRRSLQVRVFWG